MHASYFIKPGIYKIRKTDDSVWAPNLIEITKTLQFIFGGKYYFLLSLICFFERSSGLCLVMLSFCISFMTVTFMMSPMVRPLNRGVRSASLELLHPPLDCRPQSGKSPSGDPYCEAPWRGELGQEPQPQEEVCWFQLLQPAPGSLPLESEKFSAVVASGPRQSIWLVAGTLGGSTPCEFCLLILIEILKIYILSKHLPRHWLMKSNSKSACMKFEQQLWLHIIGLRKHKTLDNCTNFNNLCNSWHSG